MRKTLCVIPFGNITHPEIDNDDLFHQAAILTKIDNKRRYLGWYGVNFCAMVSDEVLAVLPEGNSIGTQQLAALLNRFCEPFFIPNEVQVTSAFSQTASMTEQLLAALAHSSAATVDEIVVLAENQVIETTSPTLMTFRNGNTGVLVAPVSNAKKTPHMEKKLIYVAPDDNDKVKMACTYEQMVELGTLEPFKGVAGAFRFDAFDLRRALESGTTFEEFACKALVGQAVGKIDSRQAFY